MHHWISVVCGPKFTKFFSPTWKGLWLNKFFSDFRYVDPFRRYSRSKSKVFRNRAKFWTIFLPSQISGGGPSKRRHVGWKKFCEDTPTSPEVIGAYTLNFKPNFKFSRLQFFGGTPVPVWVCASKAWSISSACKNLRSQHPLWAEM